MLLQSTTYYTVCSSVVGCVPNYIKTLKIELLAKERESQPFFLFSQQNCHGKMIASTLCFSYLQDVFLLSQKLSCRFYRGFINDFATQSFNTTEDRNPYGQKYLWINVQKCQNINVQVYQCIKIHMDKPTYVQMYKRTYGYKYQHTSSSIGIRDR